MPDIVLLQEIVPQSQKILEEKCPDFQVFLQFLALDFFSSLPLV